MPIQSEIALLIEEIRVLYETSHMLPSGRCRMGFRNIQGNCIPTRIALKFMRMKSQRFHVSRTALHSVERQLHHVKGASAVLKGMEKEVKQHTALREKHDKLVKFHSKHASSSK